MIKKLLQKLDEVLNPIQLYEMSKAFSYKDKRIDVCAWVENPMGVDNMYFKYYNCSTIPSATKVARIRIDKCQYVGGRHKENGKQPWILNKTELKELMDILKSESDEHIGLTRWQDIIITYNKDNFNLTTKECLTNNFENAQRDPKMPKHLQPLDINTPMPNYMELS